MPTLAPPATSTHDVLLKLASSMRNYDLPEPRTVGVCATNALITIDAAHADRWLRSLSATGRETSHSHTARGTISRTVAGTLDGLAVRVVWDEPVGCTECGGGS